MREDVYYVSVKKDDGGYRMWHEVSRHWTKHRALENAARLERKGYEVGVSSREHVGGGQYIRRCFDVNGRETKYTCE